MNLNTDIGNFSKRRALTQSDSKTHEEDEYDKWDDEEEYDDYEDFEFKLYTLNELEQFNEESDELNKLITPWWKNLRTIFTKSTLGKIGLLEYKRKSLLKNETFSEVDIEDKELSLKALKTFATNINERYHKQLRGNLYGILAFYLLANWTGWSFIWYFLIGSSLYSLISHYFKYRKNKKWVIKAENFIEKSTYEGTQQQEESSRLDEIMKFNTFISQEENEHWSIKLYDAIADLFKRKK